MAIPAVKSKIDLNQFLNLLSSAACELVLLFFLLVDALLSYLLTKFAKYCELQIPCILCSRLDHIIGNKKPESYCNVLCTNHRSEISSLISCHRHGKLADVEDLCEDCLLSFAAQNKSHPKFFWLLAGKLWPDLSCSGLPSSMLKMDIISAASQICSCCGTPWTSRPNAQKLLQLKPFGVMGTKPGIPLPIPVGRNRLAHLNGLKNTRDRISGESKAYTGIGGNVFDPLSKVGYSELKLLSDSESEFLFSDDDDRSNLPSDNESKEDLVFLHASYKSLVKQAYKSEIHAPLLDLMGPTDVGDPQKDLASDAATWHGLGELDWQRVDHKSKPSGLHDLLSQDVLPSASGAVVLPVAESDIKYVDKTAQLPVDFSDSKDASELASDEKHEDSPIPGKQDTVKESDGDIEDSKVVVLESTTALKAVVSELKTSVPEVSDAKSNGIELLQESNSPEQHKSIDNSLEESNSVSSVGGESAIENLKQLVHVSESETLVPVVSDAPVSSGIELLQRLSSPERHDTIDNSRSPDEGNKVCDIEGESAIDKLKRQMEHDRGCMNALYKELEEERSASAIAANQAMAMITRLQEEKATLHMEALQYLRMMEEQAEYDVDALEKANDLLAERDRDVQDLEAELEIYRSQFPDEIVAENPTTQGRGCMLKTEEKTSDTDFVHKLYLSETLKKMEGKVNKLLSNSASHAEGEGESYSEGSLATSEDADLIALKGEILSLGERLKALEANSDTVRLKDKSHSLQNGSEGVQSIQ